MLMKNGGILGFHCGYRYPQTVEGTYYDERYPLTLKGTDAVIFTLFRAFGLTVHIKAYGEYCYGGTDNAVKLDQSLTSTNDDIGAEPKATDSNTDFTAEPQIHNFEHSHYVGGEISRSVTWVNEPTAQEDRKQHLEVAKPVTSWIGNETEIEWNYTSLALLVVIPEFLKRNTKAEV